MVWRTALYRHAWKRNVAIRITESSWRFIAAMKKLLPFHVEISRSRTVIDMNNSSESCSGLKHVMGTDANQDRLVAPGQRAGGGDAKRDIE